MHPGRILGGILGLGILGSTFLLPFWNLTTGQPAAFDTLYSAFRFVLSNLSGTQSMGLLTLLMYLVLLAGAMMIAAGAFGAFPLGAGILSFLAMLGLTLGPFLLFPSFPFDTRNYGIGFWALWGLSILMLFAASWTRTGRKRNEFSQNAPMESGVKPPQVG